jgi:uncharacterized protein with HEPN domain
MTRDNLLYLQDIWESIKAIEEYSRGLSIETFSANRQTQDAIIRRFEIIGEAVKKLDEDIKKQASNVPWKEMAGMRDVLIHEYFGVNIDRVWETIKKDLPSLKKNIKELIK